MKIIFENVIASIRVLTGAFAFLFFIIIAAGLQASPRVVLFGGLIVYVWFYVLGGAIANVMAQIDKEITFEPIDEEAEEKEQSPDEHLGAFVDVNQSFEMPA